VGAGVDRGVFVGSVVNEAVGCTVKVTVGVIDPQATMKIVNKKHRGINVFFIWVFYQLK
jgi:hypothetical protein